MGLALISAGAAKGVVEALASRFTAATGERIDASFGAVGAMKERLLAGSPCDAIILTQALVEGLAGDGRVDAATIAPLGRVHTGVAVRERDPDVAIDAPDGLRRSLLAATSVFLPDPQNATAGIHFMSVLVKLGIREELASRLRAFPNGATAMAALAQATDARPVGCTQVTEILYTRGARLVGRLPAAFELATLYSAAVCTGARDAALARCFVDLVSGDASRALRREGGFE
jgi:molybdate transport system substrate-binding protein